MSDLAEHFGPRARRILLRAQEEAIRLHHEQVNSGHLLLALLAAKKGIAVRALLALECDFVAIRARIEEQIGVGNDDLVGKPRFVESTKGIIKIAIETANEMGHRYVDSEHLLLALLEERDGTGRRILTEFAAKLVVIAKVIELMAGNVDRLKDVLVDYNTTQRELQLSRREQKLRQQEEAIVVTEKGEEPALPTVSSSPFLPALMSAWQEQSRLQIYEAAVQEERSRLARDLHDAVKQQLFSINLSAAAVCERIDTDRAGALAALADVQQGAQAALAEINVLLRQLSPVPLATTGLLEALREQCEALGYRTGATVQQHFGSLPGADKLPLGAQETLYRITQEAFSNIARHARARNVSLALELVDEEAVVALVIQDDGQGFVVQEITSGMGLLNMQERTEQLYGQVEIQSAPDAGTTIRVTIPLLDTIHQQEHHA